MKQGSVLTVKCFQLFSFVALYKIAQLWPNVVIDCHELLYEDSTAELSSLCLRNIFTKFASVSRWYCNCFVSSSM